MADQNYLLDIVTSINTNIVNKYIDIIFLYAGEARDELAICVALRKRKFIINNIFLHDANYQDNDFTAPIKKRFEDKVRFKHLIFSRTCDNINQLVVEEDEGLTDDDDDEKFEEPYTVCIACRPQIGNFNGNIMNDNIDINNFISTFFNSEKNNFIFTVVDDHFFLYTKPNHTACVNNPANNHHQHIHKFCFFNALYGDLAGGKSKSNKRKSKSNKCKSKSKKCKRNKCKSNKCKRKLNIYNHK